MEQAQPWTGLGGWHADADGDPQRPADVAVMMPTLVRPSIRRALRSIYDQRFDGRIQVVVGVDQQQGEAAPLLAAIAERPPHVSVLVVHPPWSTSVRHGGVHTPRDGGAIKAIMAFSANARHLAQLDDDNVWLPDHLRLLTAAVEGKAWAFSQRFLVDVETGRRLGVDIWDSVGPGAGRLVEAGGFADPNCLIMDKVRCARILSGYADTLDGKPGLTSDRLVFWGLHDRPYGRVEEATVEYQIRRNDRMWQQLIAQRRRGELADYGWTSYGQPGAWRVLFSDTAPLAARSHASRLDAEVQP